ncbi:unnamed protein product [Arctogadus glacialis]
MFQLRYFLPIRLCPPQHVLLDSWSLLGTTGRPTDLVVTGVFGGLPRSPDLGGLPRSPVLGGLLRSRGLRGLLRSRGLRGLLRTSGLGGLPRTGGLGGLLRTIGIGGLLRTSGLGGLLRTSGLGGLLRTSGLGGLLRTSGVGGLLRTGGIGGLLRTSGVGGLLRTRDLGGLLRPVGRSLSTLLFHTHFSHFKTDVGAFKKHRMPLWMMTTTTETLKTKKDLWKDRKLGYQCSNILFVCSLHSRKCLTGSA